MTAEQHAQRIRQLEFKLDKAEHGMGMPYSREDVAHYQRLLDEAHNKVRPCAVCGRIEPEGDCCIEAGQP